MPSSNPLPSAEAHLFKKILKTYEQKQYKKGLQYAKEILKKFPEHGETLSMKGLILNYTNRKSEAYECAQRGLRNDVKSHVCWHVYGLLQRSDRKYDEAIKCYRNALKCDKDNLQILRDLSLLQIQIRDLEGYRDTRYQLFQLRPMQRASWIGYGMSYHLLKDYETALSILEEYAKTQQAKPYDYENSEFLLYQNMVLREAGKFKEALEHINKNEVNIVDKLAVVSIKAQMHYNLGEISKAEALYYDLIDRNPDNLEYYQKLQLCKSLDKIEEKKELCKNFESKYPRADLPRKLPLEFLTDDDFKQQLDKYMQRAFRKGVPPLFKELKYLYKDPRKLKIIQDLCLEYANCLESTGKFHDDGQEGKDKESPTCLLWVYYYLAQHYDNLNDTANAFKYIDKALGHTPTLVELYMLKGKIYKHAGNLYEAVKWLDEAQSLDTADRYINYKCSKYMLRAGLIKEAQEIAAKFTREGVPAFDYLKEMQCMWFETECANAYKRLNKYGEALKKCQQVERHFQEIIEDQFDFHTYCMRKMTLRSYVDMLRLEDHVKSHPFFFKAAQTAIQIYISLHDKPLSDIEDDKTENIENLTPSELRKLKNKQKKQQLKEQVEKEKEKQLKEKLKALNKQKNKEDGDLETISEEDLIPEKLERPENALDECSKFLKPLEEFAMQHIETHVLAFEVYSRKNRFLLMLKSLKRIKQIDDIHPKFHYYLCKFLLEYNKHVANLHETVKEVINEELKNMYDGSSVENLNDKFLQKNAQDLECISEAAKILHLTNPNASSHISLVTNISEHLAGRTLKVCSKIYEDFKNGVYGHIDGKLLDDYRLGCNRIWPHANVFQDDHTLAKYVQQSLDERTNDNNNGTSDLARQLEKASIHDEAENDN